MSISPTLIYIWQLADDLRSALYGLTAAGTLASVAYFLFAFVCYEERRSESAAQYEARREASTQKRAPVFFRLLAATVVAFVASFIIPRSNTIAMMVVIPEIAKSKAIQADIPDLYNAAVNALKTALKK